MNETNDYYNEVVDDFGQSECCEQGRMRYHGGSRYYCNWCGQDEIRPAHGFKPHPPEGISLVAQFDSLGL